MNDTDIANINNASANITNAASVLAGVGEYKSQREWQEKMYEKTLADQREDIANTREYNESIYNKYNSPAALYDQYRSLGINPNSIAENIVGHSSPMADSNITPNPQVPSSPVGVGAALGSAANNSANIALASATLAKTEAETRQINIDNETRSEQNQLTIDQAKQVIKQSEQEINESISRKNLTDEQAKQVRETLPLLLTKSQAEIDEIGSIVENNKAQLDTLRKQLDLIDEQIKTQKATTSSIEAQTELTGTQTQLNELQKQRDGLEYEYEQEYKSYRMKLLEKGLDPDKIQYGSIMSALGISQALKDGRNWLDASDNVKRKTRSNTGRPSGVR